MRFTNFDQFYSIQKNVTTSGIPVRLSGYYAATTIAFNDNGASADTITNSANLFLKMGFKPGDYITVAGSSSNDGTYLVASVTSGTITLDSAGLLETEAAGASVVLDTTNGIKVEDGVGVLIKAKASNTGVITVGSSSARALNTNTDYLSNYRLSAGQYITLQIKNLKAVWVDAEISGEGVEVLLEA